MEVVICSSSIHFSAQGGPYQKFWTLGYRSQANRQRGRVSQSENAGTAMVGQRKRRFGVTDAEASREVINSVHKPESNLSIEASCLPWQKAVSSWTAVPMDRKHTCLEVMGLSCSSIGSIENKQRPARNLTRGSNRRHRDVRRWRACEGETDHLLSLVVRFEALLCS